MNLPGDFTFYLLTPPDQTREASRCGLPLAHMAYRIGGGPHLFCAQHPFTQRGGIMSIDHQGFDGKGGPDELCREILRECAAHGFSGVFCDFEGPALPLLQNAVHNIAPLLEKRGWRLYLPESYGENSPDTAQIVVSTALTTGSLRDRLRDVAAQFGPHRIALGLERIAEDFALPAAQDSGRSMSRDELRQLLVARAPAVYFSDELCAHYFTYMRSGGSAHFILYDDASSMVKKLRVAASLGIHTAFIPYVQMGDLLPALLG